LSQAPTGTFFARSTLQRKFIGLAIKTFLLVAAAWIGLSIFGGMVETYFEVKNLHLQQISSSIATVAISLVIISAIRSLLQKTTAKIGVHLSTSISFFVAVIISLIAVIAIMYQWTIDPQSIIVGGGVAAIILGIGISTIVGNMLSAGLMLTTFPARIGDSIYIVNDQIRGKIEEINFIYTKITTDTGTEYVVPNNAIVQGNVRITKDKSIYDERFPFVEGDHIDIANSLNKYSGIVSNVTANFTIIHSNENKNEVIFANTAILSGQFVITKKYNTDTI
jgi:small conductance mechanosensitive channel